MAEVVIDGTPMALDDIWAAADGAHLRVGSEVRDRMAPARRLVEEAVERGDTMYGVTTGFGALASTRIDPSQAREVQVALLRSHAAGVGDPLPLPLVRAMLALRARTLAQGHSGVRPVVVERLVDLANAGLIPVVPELGSVGASGDLAPFAHLALPLIGEGEVWSDGERLPAAEGLAAVGLEPLALEAKEGLSLLNGTEGMLAWLALGLRRAIRLVDAVDIACALSVEALMGSARPFRPEVHALRPHPGQQRSARIIAALIEGSAIEAAHHDDFVHAVQDAYSLRCAPQVHGAVRDTIAHAWGVAEIEAGSVVDNPLVLADSNEVVSAGNFHGQPLAFVLDYLTIGITEVGNISERRTDRLLDPQHSSGLSPFLAQSPGVESGLMLAQYTAAALVAESRVLAHPASVESIPTSGSQEDHVSMGWGAGRKLWQVLEHIERVVAIELMCAAAGVEQRPAAPATGTGAVLKLVRRHVAPISGDRPPAPDIESLAALVRSGEIAAAASATVEGLGRAI